MKKGIVLSVLGLLGALATMFAGVSAGSVSVWVFYQPREPRALRGK